MARFKHEIRGATKAIALRFRHPDQVFADYFRAKADIEQRANLPRMEGTVDIYPVDIAPLLASDLAWDPRPVIQSYSAYSPALAAMNAHHLEVPGAPKNVLFAASSIDDRFPNLEDGASWRPLLSHYAFKRFSGPYALLVRTNVDHHATVGAPFLDGTFAFGTDIPVSAAARSVWASFTFQSPLIGRLLSAVFKRPQLFLDVTYRSGEKRTFRLVAGMSDGFLLSPVIQSARDFVLLSTGRQGLQKWSEVQSIKVRQDSLFPFWGADFHLTLSPLNFDPHHVVEKDLYGTEGLPIAQMPAGGRCSIDVVTSSSPGLGDIGPDTPSARVEGWAFVPGDDSFEDGRVKVALTDSAGRTFYTDTRRTARPDAAQQLGVSDGIPIGFASTVDLRSLHGDVSVQIVQQDSKGSLVCRTVPVIIRH